MADRARPGSRTAAYRALALLAVLAAAASADEAPVLPGHSAHGAAWNEGPRQRAILMPGTGAIDFPVTTRNPMARRFVLQGIGQLHGYWFYEAERSFRQAAALDPGCAIAYLGMAMAARFDASRAAAFVAKAEALAATASPFERSWIAAFAPYIAAAEDPFSSRHAALITALREIAAAYPADLESRAFLAEEALAGGLSNDETDALIQYVLDRQPMHPCLHYRIHLWDMFAPEKSLTAAARCGQAAPGIAHMWHMPGHVYSALHRYDDAAWQQEAAARVDHAYTMRARVMPDQIHNYAHNLEWLIRDLVIVGRVHDAVAVARNLLELPRHPRYNLPSTGGSAYYGRFHLFDVLEKHEMWEELLAHSTGVYLDLANPMERALCHRRRALALIMLHRLPEARAEARKLLDMRRTLDLPPLEAMRRRRLPLDRFPVAALPEPWSPVPVEPVEPSASDALIAAIDTQLRELECYFHLAAGDSQAAAAAVGRASLAPEVAARFWIDAGKPEVALALARKALGHADDEALPLAKLIDTLDRCGAVDEARMRFEQLRARSGSIDLDVLPYRRLAGFAARQGLGRDWRIHSRPRTDVGARPSLDSLGPLRWSPYRAPSFSLPDAFGKPKTLADLAGGRPTILVMFLGHECVHCTVQLKVFGPRTAELAAQGIRLAAITTDTAAELSQALLVGPMPFPILADPACSAFKAMNAYDDFEGSPLHAVFLIDGAGRVRWQDIYFQPFTDIAFLMNEAQRLLAQPLE